MNLIIFLSSYFIIIASIIGYGSILNRILNKKISLEFEFNLLGSILFLITLSFLTHFFFNHDYFHNGIILILGLILFIYTFVKNKKLTRSYSKYYLFTFGILIFGLMISKSHDDFSYYHFPYTYYLTQENLIIGTGSLNHGFRTPSSIFYLNSLFYLPYIKYFSFNMGATILFGVSNLILIFKLKNDFKNKRYDFIFLLSLLSFLFINIFFYRIAEHGTDRSAQILILILFIEILSLLRNEINLSNFFSKIFILLGIIISLKAFYVLYLLTFIPIFLLLKKQNLKNLIIDFFKNLYFYLFLLVGSLLVIVNIFNSGCILYPVEFTCLSSLEWSLKDETKMMNDWYEQWAKAGAGPNFRVDNPENYIQGFNWVGNWIDKYFFNKVLDFFTGIIFLMIVVFIVLYSKNLRKIEVNKKIFGTYAVLIILFIEWFYNHPSLRYGGYSLIALIFFIPISIYISRFKIEKNFKSKILILITVSLIIFLGRNIMRINNEINKYDYNFMDSPYYLVDANYFEIDYFIKKIKETHNNCKNIDSPDCNIYNGIQVKEKNNYLFLIRKK